MAVRCRDETLSQRFFQKVVKGSGPDDCWEWVGAKQAFGYGCIGTSRGLVGAHRVSWGLHFGQIPDGACVLHTCDNPRCNNPRHLFLGTRQENAIDRNQKGRGKNPIHNGAANHFSKLTENDVRAIRASNDKVAEIAERYGVRQNTIYRIRQRVRWASVA